MKKRIAAFLCCMILIAGLLPNALAQDQRVYDYSGVFSSEDKSVLESTIDELRSSTKVDWVILTIDDAQGKSSRSYAEDFYVEHGFGSGTDDSGSLFMIDFDNGEIYIATCGKAIDYITDARRETIFDQCFDDVVNGEYFSAAMAYLELGGQYVAQGVPEDHYRVDEETGEITPYRPPLSPFTLILFAAAAAVIALVFRFGVTRGYSVKASSYTYPFMAQSKLALTNRNDLFQNRFVTTRHIPRSDNHNSGGISSSTRSSGGGGSSVHRGSGGHSFGGGGRKFK